MPPISAHNFCGGNVLVRFVIFIILPLGYKVKMHKNTKPDTYTFSIQCVFLCQETITGTKEILEKLPVYYYNALLKKMTLTFSIKSGILY